MNEDLWNERVARSYDARDVAMNEPELLRSTVDFLAGLAQGGAALEFAIGTGRVALPLAERGVPVSGIDSSEAMLAELRKKPGADSVPVLAGDMATDRVPGRFKLVYLVYNTITNLLTQDEQVECFRNAARHLDPGGFFVIEVFLPPLRRLPPGQTAAPFDVSETHLGFDTYDLVNQRLVSHHYWTEGDRVEVFRAPFRYVWPSELDLMARLAGLELHERVADWDRAPFTDESTSHISVWRLSE